MICSAVNTIFQKDYVFWTRQQLQSVEQFINFNSFLSKIYDRKYTEKLIKIIHYTRIAPNKTYKFQGQNKQSVALILLKGSIQIEKISNLPKQQKRKTMKKFRKMLEINRKCIIMHEQNSTHLLESQQCLVKSTTSEEAEILFIPKILYEKYMQQITSQNNQRIIEALNQQFSRSSKRQLLELAEQCQIKKFIIKHQIYKEGQVPLAAYILLEGNVRIQKNQNLIANKTQKTILSPKILFGHKDLGLQYRQSTVICSSAFVQVLLIPKISFLKFARGILPDLFYVKPLKNTKQQDNMNRRFSSELQKLKRTIIKKSETKLQPFNQLNLQTTGFDNNQLSKLQQKILCSSHRLQSIDRQKQLKQQRSKNKIRKRSPRSSIDASQNPEGMFETKYSLFKRLYPNPIKFDLTNKLF